MTWDAETIEAARKLIGFSTFDLARLLDLAERGLKAPLPHGTRVRVTQSGPHCGRVGTVLAYSTFAGVGFYRVALAGGSAHEFQYDDVVEVAG